jgi:streptomycin 6-kinase
MESIMHEILSRFINKKKGEAKWVEELPAIIAASARRWNLRIEAPLSEDYVEMSYSYIAAATRMDGREVILKIGSHDAQGGLSQTERDALRLCNGQGTVELLDDDEELGVLLLERVRPGIPLGTQPDDAENTRIAARMMRKFWQPVAAEHVFRPTADEIEGFDRLRQRFGGTTELLPEKWVRRAETLYEELMASSTESVVLHGDLHHWNILRAEREPWLVIDPKGLVGDPGYEVGAFLATHPDESCKGRDRRELVVSRVNVMAEELDISRERIIKWGIVLALIWARWAVSSDDDGWRPSIERAEILESML